MAQTVIRNRESTENIPSARRVRDVDNRIAYLDPDAAPFTTLLMKAGSRTATQPKVEWFEKDLEARWDNTTQTRINTDTTVTVANPSYFQVNDIVNVVGTGEKIRVTAVNTGTSTLTITRGVGSTAAASMNNLDDLQIIGNAYAEGALKGAEHSHIESNKFNYTQIVRAPFGVTGTQDNSENYIGPDRPRLRREKAIYHKIDIERVGLFGERNIDTSSTDNPIRYAGGLLYFLTSNVTDAGGVLTEPEVETVAQNAFGHVGGSNDTRFAMISPLIVSVIDQLAAGRLMVAPKEKTYGLSITQWVTAHGTFLLAKHRLLENGPQGAGYGGFGFIVDPSKIQYCTLRNRATKLRIDIQSPDADAWTDEYMTECTWIVQNPELHAVLKNVTG